jgi:hypothetical protein
MSDVRSLEDHRFGRKLVQVGCVHLYASVARDRGRSLLVRKKKNQIGLSSFRHNFQIGTKSALSNLCNYLALASRLRRNSWMKRDQFERVFQ